MDYLMDGLELYGRAELEWTCCERTGIGLRVVLGNRYLAEGIDVVVGILKERVGIVGDRSLYALRAEGYGGEGSVEEVVDVGVIVADIVDEEQRVAIVVGEERIADKGKEADRSIGVLRIGSRELRADTTDRAARYSHEPLVGGEVDDVARGCYRLGIVADFARNGIGR